MEWTALLDVASVNIQNLDIPIPTASSNNKIPRINIFLFVIFILIFLTFYIFFQAGQTGGEQPDDDILVPLFLLIAGEEPVAEQDGQAVHQIFAEQRKSAHDENGSHAQTAVSEFQPAGEQQGSQGHQSGIEHGSAHAADDKVVGDEHIRRAVDRRQTGQQGVPGGALL